MITFQFKYGNGDKEADKITDELIWTTEMAKARAVQELCNLFKIVISRELRTTPTPTMDIGQQQFVSVPHLNLYGNNRVVGISTTLSRSGSYDDVSLQEYKDMP